MWVQIAVFLVSLLVSYASRPRARSSAKAATLEDFDFPQGTEGTEQIEVFGTVWVDDWMVLGVGNFSTKAIRR